MIMDRSCAVIHRAGSVLATAREVSVNSARPMHAKDGQRAITQRTHSTVIDPQACLVIGDLVLLDLPPITGATDARQTQPAKKRGRDQGSDNAFGEEMVDIAIEPAVVADDRVEAEMVILSEFRRQLIFVGTQLCQPTPSTCEFSCVWQCAAKAHTC